MGLEDLNRATSRLTASWGECFEEQSFRSFRVIKDSGTCHTILALLPIKGK